MDKSIGKNVREGIKRIAPYVPGKPMEELQRAYGLDIEKIIKLASNENPMGPSPRAVEAVRNCAGRISRYPESSGYYLTNKLAKTLGVSPDNIILGSGSSEIISMAMEIFINQGEEVIYPTPSFLVYRILACKIGAVPVEIPLKSDFSYDMDMFLNRITKKTKVIILCNPNNPTGTVIHKEQLKNFMAKVPDGILIISDEAYNEYVENEDAGTAFPYFQEKNVVIARTFSKIYGLAGLRIGYGTAKSDIAGFMERIRPPFNTTIPAQEAAIAALDDKEYVEKSFKNNAEGKRYLYGELKILGIEHFPTEANFILCRFKTGAAEIISKLEKKGIIIRNMEGLGTGYARITIGTPPENAALINALRKVIKESVERLA